MSTVIIIGWHKLFQYEQLDITNSSEHSGHTTEFLTSVLVVVTGHHLDLDIDDNWYCRLQAHNLIVGDTTRQL